jgi:predicted dehydrogenase
MRVGVIGCGFMGKMHARVYSMIEGMELCGVADTNPGKAKDLAEEHGCSAHTSFDSLLGENPDVLDICLPTFLHKEFTVKAAEAGKHVVCEKPMALTLTDADEMMAACKKAGVYFMVAHCIRFWPEYVRLKEIHDSGELGRLLSINLTRLGEFPTWSEGNWLANEALSGGGVLDMHIHDTDYALYLLGQPEEVASYGTIDDRGASFAFTTLGYRNCVAHLEGGWNLPKGTPFRMTFRAIFEGGAVLWENGPLTIFRPDREAETVRFKTLTAPGGGNLSSLGGYYRELEYFVNCIRHNRPLEIATPQTSRASLALVLREIEQIKSRYARQ